GYYLANFTAKAAEDAYQQITDLFQHEISDRIPLIVYQSHNDFAVTNAVDLPTYSEGIGGVTELFKNRVAIPFTGDYRDYRRVVHHELVHAVINDMFYGGSIQSIIQNNIQLRIPLWFNEGLAEYSALGWDTDSDMYIRDAILEDYLAPIERLNGYFAYRGGQSVWDYVAEQYGREKIGEILQRLRLTRSVETSFRRATGMSLEDLSEKWQRSLKEIHFPELTAREDLDQIGRPLITVEEGYYNTSPALSPKGDRLAYITTRGAFFDVYVADANDGRIIRKVIDGQDNTAFESLRILTPGISWSPDGERIAVAVKSGPSDAIAVVNVRDGSSVHYRVPDIDQILTVSWSPNGERIAFSASMNAQSDIYVLDMTTRETINYTNDVFSDHEPSWSPDGESIVFHSDRGSHTDLGRFREENFQMVEYDYSQHDIYLMSLDASRAERLTFDELWDDRSAKFGADPDRLLFISDRNGIFNLYEKNLDSGSIRPLTNVSRGIIQAALSADGNRAALVSLRDGTPSIYTLRTPFERSIDRESLAPTVWAQRVMQETMEPAPAVALARPALMQSNPLLRDASDGIAYAYAPGRRQDIYASRAPIREEPVTDADADADADAERNDEEAADNASPSDTSSYGGVRVDFRNYVFSDSFDEATEDAPDPAVRRFAPSDNVDDDGDYVPKRYKLSFSPDLVYGTAGYDALYGVQGVT
ncbi:MAG: peptidase S9, partial [Rhodothermales bacterium]